jgi:hypothetical protein
VSHIQIRFNTKANGSNLVWRIIIDGLENLAEEVEIIGTCYGEKSIVDGENKYNIACNGKVYWKENKAIITTE